jgi:hypothetical protein
MVSTSTSPGSPGPDPPAAADDEAARWKTAAQIRREHPRWVVIWSQLRGEFQARPLFGAPRGTVAVGPTPDDLIAQMNTIQAAAPRRADLLPPPGSTSSSADSQARSESS